MGWKGLIAALERLYLQNCKQASLLRLLGVLDSHHPPDKGRQLYTQKTEQQGRERRSVAVTALTKHLSYSEVRRTQKAVPTESVPLRAYLSTEPEFGLDLGGACSLGPASDPGAT